MIARALGILSAALSLGLIVQSVNLVVSQRKLSAVHTLLATEQDTTRRLQGIVDRSEQLRQAEREQCAQDFAGEVERNKIELAKASKAALARSQITGQCPRASTQAERLSALCANSGEK